MRIVACVAVLLTIVQSAFSQTDPRNAAFWYQRAVEQYNIQFTQDQRAAVDAYLDNPNGPPPPDVAQIIQRAQPIFSLVGRGSTQEINNNQLDYSQGFELLLPHLSPMRGIVRLMSADATARVQNNDANGAASLIDQMYGVAGHMGDDRVLISSLIGQSIFTLADRALQAGLDRNVFTAD